jgi:fibronectin type 3 domain-containing protein
MPGYSDSSLTSGVSYDYQVQAFDFVNNHSPLSPTLNLTTYITSGSAATNLVATAKSAQEIDLSWSPPTNQQGLSSYLILSGTSLANLQQIAIRPNGTLTYKAMSLAAGTTYYFGIVAVEQGINAPMSNGAYATTLPLPPPPSSVAVSSAPLSLTPIKVVLTWQENILPGGLPISRYEIFQSTTPGVFPTTHGSALTPTYTATSLTPNTTYYFEVVAVDNGAPSDYSAPSDQLTVTTLPMPAAPVSVAATASSATKVTVKWTENVPAGGLPISNFTVFRGPTSTSLTSLKTTTASPYNDTSVTAGNTYYYAVEATDSARDVSPMSAVSAPVTTPVSPAAPSGVGIQVNSETQLTVTWSETIPTGGLPITSYTVNWGTTPALGTSATRTTAKFVATGLAPGTTYYFAVQATDSGGAKSAWSPTVHGATAVPPAAPVIGSVTPNANGTITVNWTEANPPAGMPQISTFNIYEGPTSTGPWGSPTTRGSTTFSYTQSGLTPGQTYCYYLTATDKGQDVSPPSAAVCAAAL